MLVAVTNSILIVTESESRRVSWAGIDPVAWAWKAIWHREHGMPGLTLRLFESPIIGIWCEWVKPGQRYHMRSLVKLP